MSVLQPPRTESERPAGPRLVAAGDLVIAYERHDKMTALVVTADGRYDNKFGNFRMSDWIGRPLGSRVSARKGGGWVLLLAPSAELWTSCLRHRTQILYLADISMAVAFMELRPGSVVLETGTGSGSLTTSMARAVAPTGHVHTFEFHEQRSQMAEEEFASNGLSQLITVTHRDTEAQGFPEALAGTADAVFLDLPGPAKVVPSAAASLRPDGVIVSFSPCIEQVQRTCEALVNNGFVGLRTFESILRYYDLCANQSFVIDLDAAKDAGAGRDGKRGRQTGKKRARPAESNTRPAEAETAEGPDAPIAVLPAQTLTVAKPCLEARGHTGYLTVARKAVLPMFAGTADRTQVDD